MVPVALGLSEKARAGDSRTALVHSAHFVGAAQDDIAASKTGFD